MGTHTATYKGRWVWVKLVSGETFIDQFITRTKNKRVIFKGRIVRQGDIKSFNPNGSNSPNSDKRKICQDTHLIATSGSRSHQGNGAKKRKE